MTKPDFTLIAVVLDKSGSMGNTRNDTIGGFNTFLDTQKKAPGEALMCLYQFDSYYKPTYEFKPIKDVTPLTFEDYTPNGGTALNDAIGKTIDSIGKKLADMKEEERPSKVIIAIMTDGEENESKTYSKLDIKTRIEHQTNVYSWEFVFLAANQDAIVSGAQLGISAASALSYSHSRGGYQSAFKTLGSSVTRSRGTKGLTPQMFTEEDKALYAQEQKAIDAQTAQPIAQAAKIVTP